MGGQPIRRFASAVVAARVALSGRASPLVCLPARGSALGIYATAPYSAPI